MGQPAFATPSSAAVPVIAKTVDDARLSELEKETGDRPIDSILEQALAYDERGQFSRASELYQKVATQGVGVAELRLGWFNESGQGGEQSYTLARSHYEKAASLGVAEANLRLGLLYLEGWGVTRDVATAVANLRLAANANYAPAQQILSQIYFTGIGVSADLKEALLWAEKAAVQRGPEAQALVGSIRAKVARLPEDIRSAREWFQLSAEQDYARGMISMAATFIKPGADAESIQLGVRWLELAAEGGSAAAAFHLAGMHLFAPQWRNKPDHEEQARMLLMQAAQAGEYAAREVLEQEKTSKSLQTAYFYVRSVPVEVRYMQRLAARPPTADEIAKHQVRPRPIKMVRPIYPQAMQLTKTEAEVQIEFVIDTTGRVRDAKAINNPHPAFSEPAVAAAMGWRFTPGYKNEQAVNTRVRIAIRFNLSDLPEPGRKTAAKSDNGAESQSFSAQQ